MKATIQFHKTQIANYVSIDCNGKQISKILSPDNKTATKEFKELLQIFKKRNIEVEISKVIQNKASKEEKIIRKEILDKRIFALRIKGLSYATIGSALHISAQQAMNRFKRKLKQAA